MRKRCGDIPPSGRRRASRGEETKRGKVTTRSRSCLLRRVAWDVDKRQRKILDEVQQASAI